MFLPPLKVTIGPANLVVAVVVMSRGFNLVKSCGLSVSYFLWISLQTYVVVVTCLYSRYGPFITGDSIVFTSCLFLSFPCFQFRTCKTQSYYSTCLFYFA